jgi:DNA-binding beta-propeller fold protein YncE
MRTCIFVLGIFLLISAAASAQQEVKPYKVQKSIPVSGNGSWDYLAYDNSTNRVFVSHGDCVQVIDMKTGKQVGVIDHTPGVHGIALASFFGKGFISAGKIDSVIVFDLNTYEITARIAAGSNPDAILYDPFSYRIFVFNAKGNSITVIHAGSNDVDTTVHLRGNPEYAVTDYNGSIFVNIENIGMVMQIDSKTLGFKGMFPLGPGTEPTGMAIDLANNYLFCGCSGTNELVVLDIASSLVAARIPIGMHCDGVCYLPSRKEIFTSNGEGTITVISQDVPDKYSKKQTLVTKRGARTLTLDHANQTLLLPTAEFNDEKKEYNKNSFQVLVVAR